MLTRLFTRLFKRRGRPKELADEFSSEKIVVHGKKSAKPVVVLLSGMELVHEKSPLGSLERSIEFSRPGT